MRTLSQRLQQAIDRLPPEGRRRGIKLLLRKLKAVSAREVKRTGAQPLRGLTYPSWAAYLNPKAKQEPSIDLLRAVAEVTGVSARWLILGQGPPTIEARVTRGTVSPATLGHVEALRLEAEIYSALGFMPLHLPDPPAAGATSDAVNAYEAAIDVAAANLAPWLPALLDAQRRLGIEPGAIGNVLRGPLEALDVDTSRMPPGVLDSYVITMLPVLFGLVAPRREQLAMLQPYARKRSRKRTKKREITKRTKSKRRAR